MPIYEYYCPQNHTIYQFYAKSLAQGRLVPKCPDNPKFQMRKLVSGFAITGGGKASDAGPAAAEAGTNAAEDPRLDAAMSAMEREFSGVDENDPRAMARMMRKMSELTGEKIDGQMEEVVRKLEEGTDPESLEDQMGGDAPGEGDPMAEEMGLGGSGEKPGDPQEAKHRFKARRTSPRKDPKLYDFE